VVLAVTRFTEVAVILAVVVAVNVTVVDAGFSRQVHTEATNDEDCDLVQLLHFDDLESPRAARARGVLTALRGIYSAVRFTLLLQAL
jgi:hypothetical protein